MCLVSMVSDGLCRGEGKATCRSRRAAMSDERGVTGKLHLCNHESLQTTL